MEGVAGPQIIVEEDRSVTIEFKVAVDSNGNSWDTDNVNFTFLPVARDSEFGLDEFFTVCDSDFPQNYCYNIDSVDRSQEGLYIASATSKCTQYPTLFNEIINL